MRRRRAINYDRCAPHPGRRPISTTNLNPTIRSMSSLTVNVFGEAQGQIRPGNIRGVSSVPCNLRVGIQDAMCDRVGGVNTPIISEGVQADRHNFYIGYIMSSVRTNPISGFSNGVSSYSWCIHHCSSVEDISSIFPLKTHTLNFDSTNLNTHESISRYGIILPFHSRKNKPITRTKRNGNTICFRYSRSDISCPLGILVIGAGQVGCLENDTSEVIDSIGVSRGRITRKVNIVVCYQRVIVDQ